MSKTDLVHCTKCKWTHFAVTREYAENQVKEFNEYFDKLTKKEQDLYYGGKGAHISSYEKCWCGNDEFEPGNTAPDGCTIGPVIYED